MKTILTSTVFIISLFTWSTKADYCPAPRTSFDHSMGVKVSFDKKTGQYTYIYSVRNEQTSLVPIVRWFLALDELPPIAEVDNSRWHSEFDPANSRRASHLRWYTIYATEKSNTNASPKREAPDAAIRPGQSLTFRIKSFSPPSITRYYVDGFQDIPIAYATDQNPDPDLNCPNLDMENPLFDKIITGMTVGPQNPNVMPVKMRLRKNDGRDRCGPFEPKKPKGQINLVVFSSKEFDATQIDMNTVKFGPEKVAPISSKAIPANFGNFSKDEDEEWERQHESYKGKIDGGQRRNLIMTFNVASLGIQCGLDKALFLNAKTVDGKSIFGGVTTKTTGCDVKKPGKRKSKEKN